jgi:hypothetical protein
MSRSFYKRMSRIYQNLDVNTSILANLRHPFMDRVGTTFQKISKDIYNFWSEVSQLRSDD